MGSVVGSRDALCSLLTIRPLLAVAVNCMEDWGREGGRRERGERKREREREGERERESVCVCVCVRERGKKRERMGERERGRSKNV